MDNKEKETANKTPAVVEKKHNFFIDVLKGAVMGVAFIIPGFSGGTVAVILGIYNGFITAIAGLFKDFKKNALFLLPFLIGIVLGVAALIMPIKLGFEFIPLPLICLFVGLMLGGMPPIFKDAGRKPKFAHILSAVLACAFAAGICFIPGLGEETSVAGASFPTYLALAGVGMLAACGCVVPGISGSMIAMIFGFYDDVLGAASNLFTFKEVGFSLLTLATFGIGIIVGFFTVAFLMKFLLAHFRKGTYYAIIGFIVGSVFSIFYKQEFLINESISVPLQIVLAVTLFAVGFAASFIFCKTVGAREAKLRENPPCGDDNTSNTVD